MQKFRPLTLCALVVLSACPKESGDGQDDVAEATETEDSGSESGSGSTSTSESSTSESSTSGTDSTSDTVSTSDTGSTSDTTTEGGFCGDGVLGLGEECDGVDLGSATCMDFGFDGGELFCMPFSCSFDTSGCMMDPQPNGANCTSDLECMSLNCYAGLFADQCGECNEDADCIGGGCTGPNPSDSLGSFCNMGELGGGCETSDVCQPGLVCGTMFELLGSPMISSCGECNSDLDCMPGSICAPIVDMMTFSGTNLCTMPGSVPQDGYCDLDGNGDAACASGICSIADILGLEQIGACGECNTDADCFGNATCVPGVLDLDARTLTGSTCQ